MEQALVVSKSYEQNTGGVVYALPQQLLELTASRNCVTRASLEKAKADADKKLSSATANAQALSSALKLAESRFTAAATEAARARLALEVELARVDLQLGKISESRAKQAAARAAVTLEEFAGTRLDYSFSAQALPPSPSEHRFVAVVTSSQFNSTELELSTTPAGLLSGGSAIVKGELDEVFVSLVKAVSSIGAGRASPPIRGVRPSTVEPCTKGDEKRLLEVLNPADADAFAILNEKLRVNQFGIEVENQTSFATCDNLGERNGLIYPRPVLARLNVQRSSGNRDLLAAVFVPIIDTCSTGFIPIRQGRFADKEYEFEFTDGLLTRYRLDEGNELTGFLGMFPEAISAIFAIPTDLLQLRINYSSAEEGYYAAQQAALAARLALEQALRDEEALAD